MGMIIFAYDRLDRGGLSFISRSGILRSFHGRR
ncbi:predicted protein [Sclerotinia sclerotiorum 1980 UF-70]|uniref:Uncharacterized protein n=1 Tax=Sclerotinia sclerotiorum (strain ATCC 18683 / 1980 / Ss-1) TaxID=665079 RepID=A7F995_SCLS1|nr:predicted protein [Sclerotinia sclerotiorum 1980 UF-70]EDO00306.1 predicted protein [Sclerotinia sclerotiorum 1980 UF-70]